ncbi:MAG TPA: protoporphyrinogen oxidase [Candidatus Polarisedimenticolaceae bacterium]|nr:protoporphyrinogen oxidase [Candidatus Polarisedimenticolaceae bacterium]
MSRRIVVVGAGIAGLAAAHRLIELRKDQALDLEVLLLEASDRLGGCIATERAGDFLIEAGPDSFISEKPWALRLCERLGLGPSLVSTQVAHQKIYIVHNGKLVPLPEGFFLLAPTQLAPFVRTPLFSWRGKLRMLAEPLIPRGDTNADESLGAFVRRRLGSEALERVVQPLLGGIYAADPDKLSLISTMPRFKEMEKSHRSIIWAMWAEQRRRARKRESGSGARWSLFVTLAGGMQEMVDAIALRLPQGNARLNTAVTNIFPSEDDRRWQLATGTNEILETDGIILATPAFHTAQMLASAVPEAARELSRIAYASSATISLAYHDRDFPRTADSFGFVVPAVESRKIMACTFSSLKYPGRAPEGHVLMRAFVGGSLQPGLLDDNDAILERNVRAEITSLLGVNAEPLLVHIQRHPNAMPQYHVGHQARIQRIESALDSHESLALAGSAYHGVGVADCVRTGEEAAEKLFKQIDFSKS